MLAEPMDIKAIVNRLNQLEKRNRRLERALMTMLVASAAIVLMGQAVPPPRVVEAQKFVIKDQSGRARGWIGLIGQGSELVLGNSQAQPMISLEVSGDEDDMHFYGSRRSGMTLGINSANPSLSIANANGQGGAGITFSKYGPTLHLEDGNGFSTSIGVSPTNNSAGQSQHTSAASIVLSGKAKQTIWKAP